MQNCQKSEGHTLLWNEKEQECQRLQFHARKLVNRFLAKIYKAEAHVKMQLTVLCRVMATGRAVTLQPALSSSPSSTAAGHLLSVRLRRTSRAPDLHQLLVLVVVGSHVLVKLSSTELHLQPTHSRVLNQLGRIRTRRFVIGRFQF